MRWDRGHQSPNLEDRRGMGGGSVNILGLGALLPLFGRFGWRGILLIVGIVLLTQYTGICSGGGGSERGVVTPAEKGEAGKDELSRFVGFVLDDAQSSWEDDFAEAGRQYQPARLVLFTGGVSSGCGSASSAVGPFYCPADERVYLDLSFYGDMERQLGASGDFAWAYVIAHEVGHHVQQELGTSGEVDRLRREQPGEANALSVRLELQADCYSGVWAHSIFAAGDLEKGDVQEAIRASAAVGDDRLQSRGGGQVNPDSFTHGSSEQRTEWFNRGRANGEPGDCDTFSPETL
jgi:predicted metalloprotease